MGGIIFPYFSKMKTIVQIFGWFIGQAGFYSKSIGRVILKYKLHQSTAYPIPEKVGMFTTFLFEYQWPPLCQATSFV